MVLDPNDVTRWTWDRNTGAHRGANNKVLHADHQSLKPSIGDDQLIPLRPPLAHPPACNIVKANHNSANRPISAATSTPHTPIKLPRLGAYVHGPTNS